MKSSLLLVAAAAATASATFDIRDEVAAGFKLSLLPREISGNLQTFTGALGGVGASAITNSGDLKNQFKVDGDTFSDFQTAANRACDNQHNKCAQLANSGNNNNNKGGQKLTVGQCDQQSSQCKSAIGTSTKTSFISLTSSNAEFDFFCET